MRRAVKRVFAAAAKLEHLFDLSDAERLVAMLELAYGLGRQDQTRRNQLTPGSPDRRGGGSTKKKR